MERGFFIIASLIGTVWFGYTAYLAWLKPADFRKMLKDSSFVSDAKSIEEWNDSSANLWIARIFMPIGTIGCGFIFVMSIYSLIF